MPATEFQRRLRKLHDLWLEMAKLDYIVTHPDNPCLQSVPHTELSRIRNEIEQRLKKREEAMKITTEADGTISMTMGVLTDMVSETIDLDQKYEDRFLRELGGIMGAVDVMNMAMRNHLKHSFKCYAPESPEERKFAIKARTKDWRQAFEKQMATETPERQRFVRPHFQFALKRSLKLYITSDERANMKRRSETETASSSADPNTIVLSPASV